MEPVHIVIMGCGRVGSGLALALDKRGHSVAVIDRDPHAFRRLGPHFRGRSIKGVGYDRQVLAKASIVEADGFAAVSSGDNSNILAARVVRESYGVHNVVARIYDPGRAEVFERLGIPTVATVRWTTDQMLRRLLPEGSEPVWRDPTGAVRLIEVRVHPHWVGRRISEMQAAAATPIPMLQRQGQGMITNERTVFQDGDLAYAAVETGRTPDVEVILGRPPVKR
ncbi:MAG: TrkA family potassium uptake protein [Propionibacterium sp.]|nr:TrkA family potassium uptake protein [Propionibacterium sp.]